MKKRCRNSIFKTAISFSIIAVLLLFFITDSVVRMLLDRINESLVKNSLAKTVSLAVNNVLNDTASKSENMISYSTSQEGKITSADYNCVLINEISNDVAKQLTSYYSKTITQDFKTKLGNLTGIPLAFGKGPNLNYKLSYIGYPQIKFFSEFSSQGINQTRHRIIMRIKISVDTIIFLYSENVDYEFDYIICDSIIVGDVPDSFTQIAGDDREDISKINDYK